MCSVVAGGRRMRGHVLGLRRLSPADLPSRADSAAMCPTPPPPAASLVTRRPGVVNAGVAGRWDLRDARPRTALRPAPRPGRGTCTLALGFSTPYEPGGASMEKRALQGKLGRRQFAGTAAAAAGVSLIATPGLAIEPSKGQGSCEQIGPISLPEGTAFTPGVVVDQRARKPIYLPGMNAGLAGYAISEVLFWTDIMMEHAMFMSLLMPGDHLRGPRS